MTKPNDVNEAPVHGIVHMPKCWTCEGTGKTFLRTCHRCKGTGLFDMSESPTPGPWRVINGKEEIVADDCLHIAYVKSHFKEHIQRQEANAKLIAATPDLLEACKVAAEACRKNLAKYQYKDEVALLDAFKACQTAIEKALGKAWQ
jgi:hypothetical protein